ncbi:transcriptional regulator [Desulfosarcina widdelii]|uniref:Transcriptional regulator n=1 Tax=Desulfosarcina widdelii TaxID=947919 RepID=A0A5K7ZBG4_9BACT|nr:TetR/AcrR family transcriptional regulator [Desulfosarcina widdelii]BBO78140.1 transcriptional regulator [Desulfosarcina widdelii]
MKAKKENQENGAPLSKSALRRQREREQRLETILGAAQTLFAGEGYHKASMEKIADSAEVSVGTLYFYFKNKEDLLVKLLSQIGFDLRNMLGAAFKSADISMEGIREAGRIFFAEFCPHYPESIAIFFRESVGQSELVEAHRKKIFDKLIDDVRQALIRVCDNQGARFQSDLSAEVMATSIMGMFERIAYQYLIWQDRSEDLAVIGQDAVDFIIGGIERLFR